MVLSMTQWQNKVAKAAAVCVAVTICVWLAMSRKAEPEWPKPWGVLSEYTPEHLVAALSDIPTVAQRVSLCKRTERTTYHTEGRWAMRFSCFELSGGPFDVDLLTRRWVRLAEEMLADGDAIVEKMSGGDSAQINYWTTYKTFGIVYLYLSPIDSNSIRVVLVIHEY